jgi:hypothetical protein
LNRRPDRAKKFYIVLAVAMALGIALNYAGLNAIKLLFTTAVINGVLAPPLILIVLLLTSDRTVMGHAVNHARSGSLVGSRSPSWCAPHSDSSLPPDRPTAGLLFWPAGMPHQQSPHGPQHSHSHAHAAPNVAAKTMGAAVALTLLFVVADAVSGWFAPQEPAPKTSCSLIGPSINIAALLCRGAALRAVRRSDAN